MVSISDKFGKASIDSDHAIATTVKTIRSSGGSVLEAYDVSKFPTDTPAYFVTYKKTTAPVTGVVSVTNLVSWKALVNTGANTLTNLTVAPGYVDAGNAVGDFIELVPTSYWENSMVDGIRTHSNPDGTLKADTVTTPAITDASVTPAKWTNPYSFKAIVTTTYNTTPVAMTKLTFNTKSYDYNTNFSTSTSAYTAPVAGVYRFNANFQTGASPSGRMFLSFYKNGTEIQRGPDGSFTAYSNSIAGDFLLAASDTMTVYYYVGDTIPVKATAESVSFSGSLVHKV